MTGNAYPPGPSGSSSARRSLKMSATHLLGRHSLRGQALSKAGMPHLIEGLRNFEVSCYDFMQGLKIDKEETFATKEKHKSLARYLKIGTLLVLVAILLLFGSFGVRYYWKHKESKVYDIQYRININGAIKESLMKIDAVNSIETFTTGNGSEESVEIHDFKTGLTGIRFAGGEKCYIKSQNKIILPNTAPIKNDEELISLQDEIMPVKFDESLVWVAAEQPIKDQHFLLNSKVLEVCGNLPIYWLRPSYLKGTEFYDFGDPEDAEEDALAAELKTKPNGKRPLRSVNDYAADLHDYMENGASFDPLLDHHGFCCADCRRGHQHCQRVCEPLGGYMPYPYYYRGCRVICRVIMPCNWWVARMLGRV
ncbi:tenomodulin [Heptranchias perlo]|uniref:tenomodulin n=1 Tax=Heptranchias perlo TaxID=212740 RepID=UPI0035594100